MVKFVADLHIHSRFSRATSQKLTPEHLEYWAKLKGIQVVGTGDCIHPGWMAELQEKLESTGNGFYKLKKAYQLSESKALKNSPDVFFILSAEISNIYKKQDRVRKVHNVCFFPDFDAALKLQQRLDAIGNIRSDGRPILGLDAKILLDLTLQTDSRSFLVPAHIWTPWFSVLGSKSGFDSIDDCYEDLTSEIFAVETGLSSDPPMNRLCSQLDRFRLVSNSDAHSPDKLGREANIFDCELSFDGLYTALKQNDGFLGTIEFYPEEGKYHHDGHRKCGISWTPEQTVQHQGICPVCHKPVTVGVMFRVAQLADRVRPDDHYGQQKFHSITPLPSLLAEILGVKSSGSVKVQEAYHRLLSSTGSEFELLLNTSISDLKSAYNEVFAEGIRRIREGQIHVEAGYDGEFGHITAFAPGELGQQAKGQLFSVAKSDEATLEVHQTIDFDLNEFKEKAENFKIELNAAKKSPLKKKLNRVKNGQQSDAIDHYTGPCLVIAGPGTGKTHVLTERIYRLVQENIAEPEHILAVTFSNQAAREMNQRLQAKLGETVITTTTFHRLGLSILKNHLDQIDRSENPAIFDEHDLEKLLNQNSSIKKSERALLLKQIDGYKQGILPSIAANRQHDFDFLNKLMKKHNALDLNDLIYLPTRLFAEHPEIRKLWQSRFRWILVDEFQDINACQYDFIKYLSTDSNSNIFVIGDPDQAIYGFRGADSTCLDRLREDFPGLKQISLNTSYRCPQPILAGAAQVLKKKETLQGRDAPIKIHLRSCPTDRAEAEWVAATIESLVGGVRHFSMDSGMSDGQNTETGFDDISVLCRTAALFPPLIKAFKDHGLAFKLVGQKSVFHQPPLLTVVHELKALHFGWPGNISQTVQNELKDMLDRNLNLPLIFRRLMIELDIDPRNLDPIESLIRSYGSDLSTFLEGLSLRQNTDDLSIKPESVSLMTLHASKGLEFPVVFIPGCENKILPYQLYQTKSKDELGQEQRLLYVGMTRAKRELFLSHSATRHIKGQTFKLQRSPFLKPIEENLLEKETIQLRTKQPDQLALF